MFKLWVRRHEDLLTSIPRLRLSNRFALCIKKVAYYSRISLPTYHIWNSSYISCQYSFPMQTDPKYTDNSKRCEKSNLILFTTTVFKIQNAGFRKPPCVWKGIIWRQCEQGIPACLSHNGEVRDDPPRHSCRGSSSSQASTTQTTSMSTLNTPKRLSFYCQWKVTHFQAQNGDQTSYTQPHNQQWNANVMSWVDSIEGREHE